MTTAPTSESHKILVKELDIERRELGRAIREGNYPRAASIAFYIGERLRQRVDWVKEDRE